MCLCTIDGDDAPLTEGILVIGADDAAKRAGDVVGERLVILLAVLDQHFAVLYHGIAISVVQQHEVMAGNLVCLLRLKRLSTDEHIADSSRHAPVNVVKAALIVLYAGTVDGGIIFKGQTGHLLKALERIWQRMNGPFQNVQNLLTCGLDDSDRIAEGINPQKIVEGEIALGNRASNASTVDKGDVCSAGLIQKSVGAQVTQIGLGAQDDFVRRFAAGGIGITGDQIDLSACNHLGEPGVEFIRLGCHDRAHRVVQLQKLGGSDIAGPGIEFGTDFAVTGDVQRAYMLHP